MKGNILLIDDIWYIKYQKSLGPNVIEFKKVKLHPEDVKICRNYGDYSVDWIDKEVHFELINEKNEDDSYNLYGKTINDNKLDESLNEFSENLDTNNLNMWDNILNEYQNLNKQELINQLKIDYFYPIKKPK